jgi:hypothetical protein
MTATAAPPAYTPLAPPRAVRPPYAIAGAVALAVFALYAVTLAPTTQFWDASEYIAAAHALGIPHPPANPFFIIVAHVWGLLPLAADYAKRLNLLAAATSAVSAGLWFLIGERWLRPIIPHDFWRRFWAAAGAIVGATMFTVWNQSVVNEKVYTLSVLSIAVCLWLTLRWADQPAAARRDHLLLVIAYLIALSATNHLMGILVLPAVLVYVVLTDSQALLRPRLLVGIALVAVVGLSVNLFIPIRAALDPYMNQGDAWTWENLRAVLMREQFGKPSVLENPMYPSGADNPGRSLALMFQQYQNYWQYFTWQFGHDWSELRQRLLAALFLLIGAAGAWRHWKAERRSALAMGALVFTLTIALVFYLNFKWGYSQPYTGLEHEVRERDYFFVASFAVWGVWVGMGLAAFAETIARAVPRHGWAWAAPLALIALIPLLGNRLSAPRSGETVARDYARDVLNSVDPYALVVTTGDNDTFPLWHAQEVEGLRRDVSVMVLSLANTNWYLAQLQRRKPVPYPGAPVPGAPWMSRFYLNGPADTLPPYILLNQAATGTIGSIQITLDPQVLRRPYLGRSDLALLQIIRDQAGKRPIYFSSSTADIPDRMGLAPYLVNEGLVRRLSPTPVKETADIKLLPGRGYVNVTRLRQLAFETYRGGQASARRRPRRWVDKPSQNSLFGYVLVYDTIAAALREREPALATRATALRDSILANTTYGITTLDD